MRIRDHLFPALASVLVGAVVALATFQPGGGGGARTFTMQTQNNSMDCVNCWLILYTAGWQGGSQGHEEGSFAVPAGKVNKVKVWANSNPGAGNIFYVQLNKNGANQGRSCNVTDTTRYCEFTPTDIAFANGDTVGLYISETGTPRNNMNGIAVSLEYAVNP